MQKKVNLETRTVSFQTDDGAEVGSITYDELVTAEVEVEAALHGVSQKIGDGYAGALKATEDLDMTPEDWSVMRVKEMLEKIKGGDWKSVGGGGGAGVTDLAVALAEALGFSVEDCAARLKELSKEEKEAYRKHPDVAAILARIRRERAEKKEAELAAKAGTGTSLADLFAGAEKEGATA